MMETGNEHSGIVLPSEALRVRTELSLTAAEATRIAQQRGVSIHPQVVRSMEKGREVMNRAAQYGYLRVLAELVEERHQGASAGTARQEAEEKIVAELINNIRAQANAVDHFLRTSMRSVSARDLRLLSAGLEETQLAYRNAAAFLQGRAHELEGNTGR